MYSRVAQLNNIKKYKRLIQKRGERLYYNATNYDKQHKFFFIDLDFRL